MELPTMWPLPTLEPEARKTDERYYVTEARVSGPMTVARRCVDTWARLVEARRTRLVEARRTRLG
jgi:hypothetical protein